MPPTDLELQWATAAQRVELTDTTMIAIARRFRLAGSFNFEGCLKITTFGLGGLL